MHRVALTTNLIPEGGDYGQPQAAIYTAYLRVLRRVGLNAVLVTPAHEPDQVADLIGMTSGLLLSGGGDIQPSLFGEDPVPELVEVVPARDTMEMQAVEAALERDLPILGVCRGMQLLNVYFGGTLYQDLPTQFGGAVGHSQTAPWGEHQHEVRCVEGSRLHEALAGCGPLRINSFHHQAVKELAPGFTCTAEAEDGLIEAIESTEHDWVVGVQWHPERHQASATDDDPDIRIMEAFARQVRGRER